MFHRRRPRADPWEHPLFTVCQLLVTGPSWTLFWRSVRQKRSRFNVFSSKPQAHSLRSMRGGWRESNALDISVDKTATDWRFYLASFQCSTRAMRAERIVIGLQFSLSIGSSSLKTGDHTPFFHSHGHFPLEMHKLWSFVSGAANSHASIQCLDWDREMKQKTKNLREKFGCLGNYMNDGQQRKALNDLPALAKTIDLHYLRKLPIRKPV